MGSEQLVLSLGLGIGLGLLYVFASFVSNKRALRSGRFTLVVVGAMMLRMFVALAFLAGVLLMLPVSDVAFLGSFFVIFGIGLVAEISTLHRSKHESDAEQA